MNRDAIKSLVDAAEGIPKSAHDAAPAARISNDARTPGTVRVLSNGDVRRLAELFSPRPIAEYHEDMGVVLWWKFPIVEPPYVGTPNNLGFEVIVQTTTGVHIQTSECDDSEKDDPSFDSMSEPKRFFVGGWPGYHTHFTPIPIPKEPT